MPDDNVQPVITEEQKIAAADNNLGAGFWDAPPPADPSIPPPAPAIPDTPPDPPPPPVDIYETYIKENFGYDKAETLKQELAELTQLREAAKTPSEIKYANDQSKKYFEAIISGNEDEVYNELHQRRQLNKLTSGDINEGIAAEIIKYKIAQNKDLEPDEVDFIFNKKFSYPAKPVQTDLEDETEYNTKLSAWEAQVQSIRKELVIEAKMARPELEKLKTQIVNPDIPKQEVTNKPPTQEELDAAKKVADRVLQDAETNIKILSGVNVMVKDEAVEIPVSYIYTEEEKGVILGQVRAFVNKNYDTNAIFGKMWTDKDGNFDLPRMVEDLAYLNSRKQISQKLAQDGASKRLFEYTKDKKNIHLPGVQSQSGNGTPDLAKAREAVEASIWGN